MTIESLSTHGSPTAESLLVELGRQGASGVLEVGHPGEDVSHAWFRGGRVYAMQVPGYRPALGIRLLSGGLVSPEQLSAAVSEQRERFPTHLIGQVLVGMGFVSADVIDAFVREQVLDQVADLLDLPVEDARFHPGRRIQQDTIAPTDVDELLAIARHRREQRCDILAAVGGPHVVPILGAPGAGTVQTPLGPYDWALLCRVDGTRDITELARVCGFTVQESAQIVSDLTLTGLVSLPPLPPAPAEPLAPVVALRPGPEPEPEEPEWRLEGTDAGEPMPVGDLLAEFSAFVHDGPMPEQAEDADAVAAAGLAEPTDDPGESLEVYDLQLDDPLDPAALEGLPAGDAVAEPDATVAEVPTEVGAVPSSTLDGRGTTFPAGAPVAPAADGYSDTSVFMRELSSLSDDPEPEAPVVTRLVVPLTEQRRRRRFWER